MISSYLYHFLLHGNNSCMMQVTKYFLITSGRVIVGYVYTCQLYCSKTKTAAAKKVVNNWFAILFTILFICYIKFFLYERFLYNK